MKRKSIIGIIISAIMLCSAIASAQAVPKQMYINYEPAEQTAFWGYRYDLYDVQAGQQVQMNIDLFLQDVSSSLPGWYDAYTPGGEDLGFNSPLLASDSENWPLLNPVSSDPNNKPRIPFWIKFETAGDYVVAFDLTSRELDVRLPGDVNDDGAVDVLDALLVDRHVTLGEELSIISQVIADFNGDGVITCDDDRSVLDTDCEEIIAAAMGL
ncbi:MAG: hypothetical protein JXR76_14925 [Deltaproteobacteria bacterium]|nr:hypothetical protein [Deltaproteobacteria bacterium]